MILSLRGPTKRRGGKWGSLLRVEVQARGGEARGPGWRGERGWPTGALVEIGASVLA